ncbi:MAG: sensor histidine kinase [Planctomycetia bacterium]
MRAAFLRLDWKCIAPLITLVVCVLPDHARGEAQVAPDAVARIVALSVNGTPVSPKANGEIRLPAYREADLFISFEPFGAAKAGPAGMRLLYKLDPADSDWRDIDGQMRLSVVCYGPGPEYKHTGMFEFFMLGKSGGWRGTLAASEPNRGVGTFRVPPETCTVGVAIWSGGPFSTIGVLAVDGITVRRIGSRPSEGAVIGALPCDETMSMWERFGSNTESATISSLGGRFALAFHDADVEGFSGWRLRPEANLPVSPDETLEISWNEVFSIGGSAAHAVRYRGLKPGPYRFRLAAATTEGVPTGLETSAEILLPQPLLSQPWFLSASGFAAAAAAFGVWRYINWNRLQIRLARLEKAHAVSMERTRIAQDLHDELGGSLTQIALTSELTKEHLADTNAAHSQLDSIFSTARHLTRQLDAVVWAISPTQDTVESLATFIAKEAQAYLRPAGIGCRLQLPEELPMHQLTAFERRSLFLVVKEALHNVVQHADATEVHIRLSSGDRMLMIDIEDDGRGFQDDVAGRDIAAGHDGLANMRSRLSAIGGTCDVASGAGRCGTVVRLRLPLTTAHERAR